MVYQRIGVHGKAEPLFQRALKIREKVLGPEHRHTAATLHDLALVYQSMGDHAQADPLLERALRIKENVRSPAHTNTATNQISDLLRAPAARPVRNPPTPPRTSFPTSCGAQVGKPERTDIAANQLSEFLRAQGGKPRELLMTTRVGEWGDPAKLVFKGLETFTAEQLRDGLLRNPDFLLASHPLARLPEYLETVQEKIQAGYQQAGFPDVKVKAELEEEKKEVLVEVAEGPRYFQREVQVPGATTALADLLIRRLTKPYAEAAVGAAPTDMPRSAAEETKGEETAVHFRTHFGFTDKPSADRQLDATGKEVQPRPALWEKGKPASFAKISVPILTRAITNALAGFLAVSFPGSKSESFLESSKRIKEPLTWLWKS